MGCGKGPARERVRDEPLAGEAGHVNTAMSFERFHRIVRNVEDCPLEGYQVQPTCPGLAIFRSGIAEVTPEVRVAIGRDMLGNPAPAVRVIAAELLLTGKALSPDRQDALADAATRERDPGVLRALLRAIAPHGGNPRVAAALLAAADHADSSVRLQAVEALTSGANRGLAGGAAKVAALAEHDADPKIRQAACENAGRLGTDELLPLYEKLTAPGPRGSSAIDRDGRELHAACMEGLARMFHDHPSFETANEKAYQLFLRRLEERPRSEHTPPWTVMSWFCYFSHEADPAKLAAWKQRATWFDAAAVRRAMASVIADRAAGWMARSAAVESMVGLGATTAELEALRATIGDKPVRDKIAAALHH